MTGAEPLLEVCDCCGGEGFIEYALHPNQPYPDSVKPCGHCDGTGFMLIDDAEPIEIEDLGQGDDHEQGSKASNAESGVHSEGR